MDAVGTTVYAYDSVGQLLTEDGPFASDTVTNTYANRMRTALALQQPTSFWTNSFGYDPAKRLMNVTMSAGSFTYAHDSIANRLVSKLTLPNTSYITNYYDGNPRLLRTALKNSSHTALDSYVYGYDLSNERTALIRTDASTVSFYYDPIGQLTNADSSVNAEDRGYFYDAAWNLNRRTNQSETSPMQNVIMKSRRALSLSVAVALFLLTALASRAQSEATNRQRILRITIPTNRDQSGFALTCKETNVVGGKTILDFLRFQRNSLNDNDTIIVQWPSVQLKPIFFEAGGFFEGLRWLCETSGAQLCYYAAPPGSTPITNLDIVHWKSPFRSPLDGRQADYYVEETLLGHGTNGAQSVLAYFKQNPSRHFALAGSRYDQGLPLPPNPSPLDDATLRNLDRICQDNGRPIIRFQNHNFEAFPGTNIWQNAKGPNGK